MINKPLLVFILLWLPPTLSWSGVVKPFPICHTQLLNQKDVSLLDKVSRAFQRSLFKKTTTDSETIYTENECYLNVVRLFRALKKSLPELKAEQFNVLYFGTKSWFQYGAPSTFSTAPIRKTDASHTDSNAAKYHIVLEFRGWILDPSSGFTSEPLSKEEFFAHFFTPPRTVARYQVDVDIEDIQMLNIPGEDYLLKNDRLLADETLHEFFFKAYPHLNAKKYLLNLPSHKNP